MSKNFILRSVSAIVLLALVFTLYFFLHITGLKILVTLAVGIGALEAMRMFFPQVEDLFLKTLFLSSLFLIYVSVFIFSDNSIIFAFFSAFFCVTSLLFHKKFSDLSDLLKFQSLGTMGLIYVGLFPTFVIRILNSENGLSWFIYLLAVVFAGDSLAYIAGVTFGKNKLMPLVSPKKSVEGALGGALGSIIAGLVVAQWLPITQIEIAFISLFCAIFAQLGDLYESAIKRVAQIKDSGSLIPGHGGILDRIDGVLFAAPVVYLAIYLLK